MLKPWRDLPSFMLNNEVKRYYNILTKRRYALIIKRVFDIVMSLILIFLMLPIFFIVSIMIKLDSPGKIIFKQNRVTKYGKVFKIFKFRTMVADAEYLGSKVTKSNDFRITRVGKWLRKFRIDEFPQLFNILMGDLSFVGVRPEVIEYVKFYSPEMYATLLLPAGVTSLTSILYKDESKLLHDSKNPDYTYLNEILPEKMKYNLEYIEDFSFFYDIKIIIKTVLAVMKR